MNKIKNYFCNNCKKISDRIGIAQIETHYYSFDLETKDWEDLDGSETTDSQELFCLDCEHKITDFELE